MLYPYSIERKKKEQKNQSAYILFNDKRKTLVV